MWATHANAEDWVNVGDTDTMLWQARTGSGEISKNRGGKPLVLATGRIFDKKVKSYVFVKWYVVGPAEFKSGHRCERG